MKSKNKKLFKAYRLTEGKYTFHIKGTIKINVRNGEACLIRSTGVKCALLKVDGFDKEQEDAS